MPIQQIDRGPRTSMLQARWKQALRIHQNPPSFNGVRYGGAPAIVKWIENTLLVGIPLIGSAFAIHHIAHHGLTKIDVLSFTTCSISPDKPSLRAHRPTSTRNPTASIYSCDAMRIEARKPIE